MPSVHITVDGADALLLDQAADAHGMTREAMRKALDRAGLEPADHIGRQPLYLAEAVATALAERHGMGAPGRPRRRRDAGAAPD